MKKQDVKGMMTFAVKGFGNVRCLPVGIKIGDDVVNEPLLYAEDLAKLLGFKTTRKAMEKMDYHSRKKKPGGWRLEHLDRKTGKITDLHLVDETGLLDIIGRALIDRVRAWELYFTIAWHLLPRARGEMVVHKHLFTPREKAEARVYFEEKNSLRQNVNKQVKARVALRLTPPHTRKEVNDVQG